MIEDFERCYRAVQSRDLRFDGWFFTGVTTTGIYCRPSCPAITPKRQNVQFFATSAAAQHAGFRACRRCRPDAAPGSPEWNQRADVVARAMRLIADGVVDREGVHGLARHLGYSERQLNRLLVAEVGAGPLAVARAQRAQQARVLAETTDLPLADIAFASGFASVRQFNETIRQVFATTPGDLRRGSRHGTDPATPGAVRVRLAYREPLAIDDLLKFLGARAVPGVESLDGTTYRRTLRLPRGAATVELSPAAGFVSCVLHLDHLRDLGVAVQRCRRLLDLDADPIAVNTLLSRDQLLRATTRARAGLRVPGAVDPHELAFRAVLGQQVSVAGARTLAGRVVASLGESLPAHGGTDRLFPSADAIAASALDDIGIPRSRRDAMRRLAVALATGEIVLDAGADRGAARAALEALPGLGPWTAAYITMRALGDPDVFLPTDLGVRRALEGLGADGSPRSAAATAEAWRPWRSYAVMHLWAMPTRTEEP
ncbi:MAG TPA: AlkA N-terminal domain-containing protein [Acidimicrobiales bacterium]